VVLFARPGIGAVTFTLLFGLFNLIYRIWMLAQGIELRRAGQATGRFTVPDADIALSTAAGGLLGLLRMCQRHPERVTETTVDQLAEAELRLRGVPAPEAARLAALPLPDTGTW
jgi:hypothetical protein